MLADVASVHHARRAVDAGADGLVLLTAGAGGQTGWANGFAFVRAVRQWFDGPLVLAGGVADGQALLAAEVLGCDLAYMGTRFIATRESMAAPGYKDMLVAGELDDVLLTSAISGLPTSILRPSLVAAGLDPDALPADISADTAKALYGGGSSGPRRWRDIWSAGHAVSGVADVPTVAELVARTRAEYDAARRALRLRRQARSAARSWAYPASRLAASCSGVASSSMWHVSSSAADGGAVGHPARRRPTPGRGGTTWRSGRTPS